MSNNTNMLTKGAFESEKEYCIRICGLKELLELSWQDIADILNKELNYNYTSHRYRHMYTREVKQHQVEEVEEQLQIEDYILELKKEKVKVQEEKTQVNSLVKVLSREETLKEIAHDVVCSMSKDKILDIPKVVDNKSKTKGILVISDWHYGVDIETYFNTYNSEVAKQRIDELLAETIKLVYKEDISELFLVNLGDMISGLIHLPLRINSRLDVISQTIQISEVLAEFITHLTACCKVNYTSVSDNHSRLDPNKKEALQVESFVRIIDWYLEERLKDNPNVEFLKNKLGEDICSFNVFDFKVIGVHGDKDPQKKILTQLTNFTQEHYDLVLSAHKHHFYADECNETELYSNGSLMGTDDYANSLRLNNKPSQLFIVADKENITRSVYKIKLH